MAETIDRKALASAVIAARTPKAIEALARWWCSLRTACVVPPPMPRRSS